MFSANVSWCADIDTMRKLPLLSLDNLEYIGGFRFPEEKIGDSDATYAVGAITMGASSDSIFFTGHTYQQAIAEFKIPALVNSLNSSDFNKAAVIQKFSKVLNRPETGNPEGMDRIGGMAYVNGELLVNTYIYFDAAHKGTHTTLAISNAKDLANSEVKGYHGYSVLAKGAGWLSPIPSNWQPHLGGTYITGGSSGEPIISRWSRGPAAFVFDPVKTSLSSLPPSSLIEVATFLSFTRENVVGMEGEDYDTYMFNKDRENKIWNNTSRATYGFVVPGTRTYMTVGFSGGMDSGLGYRITRDDGYECQGYCSKRADDYSNYYWLWDINDLLKVKAGTVDASKVKPYDYGKFDLPYASNGYNPILGGTFDSKDNILYLSLRGGHKLQYGGWVPTVVAFKIDTAPEIARISPPTNVLLQEASR